MNIGLVGCGYWGKNIYRVLLELDLLYKFYDLQKINSVFYVDSLDVILDDQKTDAVIIATPASTHYEIAKSALLAGKHVLVEKPFVLCSRDAEELIKLAKSKQKVLMVGHLLHYHQAIIRLKELVNSGRLGNLRYIYSSRLNYGKIRTEEDVWWSFAPHDISIILSLIRHSPDSVSAFGSKFMNKNIADVAMTSLEFGRIVAHIYVSWLCPFKEHELLVSGDKGSLVFDGVLNSLTHYQQTGERRIVNPVLFEKYEPLKMEIEHFVDCIENGKRPTTDGEEGLAVVRILEKVSKEIK